MQPGFGARTCDVAVAGVRSRIIETGLTDSPTAVVFVHGNPGPGTDWRPLMDQAGEFVRCIAPDMPGYGEADKPAGFDYTSDGYGRHLGGLLDALGVGRAHLVLHDLGGPWGLAWAASDPPALASLTLIDIGVLPGYRWHRIGRIYRMPILGELLLASATRRGVAPMLRLGSKRELPAGFAEQVVRAYRNAATRRAVLRYYRATDLATDTVRAAERLTPLNPKTLVLWGGGDPYVPVRYAEEQRRFFPQAKVVVLPDSGHWPFLDDPAGSAAAIIPFLREQATSG